MTAARVAAVAVFAFSWTVCLALAQAPRFSSPGGIGDPGSARQLLPELAPGPAVPPTTALPSIAPVPERRLGQGPRVFVREVRIAGNTVLGDDVLAGIAEPFLNRELATEDLEELRRRLTVAYLERGYVNSGALLPDQEVRDGVVVFRLVEGRLTEIAVTGNTGLNDDYIRNRLRRGAGSPLNINAVEHRIQLLLQDPLISQMNVELVPGAELGEARLNANVVEANPYSLFASVANNSPPNIGGVRGELYGVARNLTGWGDALGLRYGRVEGGNDGSIAWTLPITADDTLFSLRWDRDDTGVVSEAFRDLDIASRTETYEVALAHPFYRTPQQQLTVGLVLARRESHTSLLGEDFSFTPGVINGTARITVLRFSQDWLSRSTEDVLALRSTFNFGLPILHALTGPERPNGEFQYWLGQAQYVRQVLPSLQMVLRSDLQLTRQPLFPLEQVAIGGQSTVRGYRENVLVRDNAFIASAEARILLFKTDLSDLGLGERAREGTLVLAPFYDFGTGWNKESPTPRPRDISSVGLGLRWEIGELLSAQLYYGYALRHIRNPDRDIQDSGIHFRLSARLY